jgi:hypothetical protein
MHLQSSDCWYSMLEAHTASVRRLCTCHTQAEACTQTRAYVVGRVAVIEAEYESCASRQTARTPDSTVARNTQDNEQNPVCGAGWTVEQR